MTPPLKIVITGGGTGGHISPALAIAEGVRRGDGALPPLPEEPAEEPEEGGAQQNQLLYIGHVSGLESQLVPEAGLRFETLAFSGMPRDKNPWRFLKWTLELARAIWRARALLLTFQPDRVVGTGGYVSAPVLIAAKLLNIPFHIHEPDAQPGLVNRLMGRHARSISIAFEASRAVLLRNGVAADRIHLTGNPLRHTIMERLGLDYPENPGPSSPPVSPSEKTPTPLSQTQRELLLRQIGFPPELSARGLPLILVLGGSQGARTLNHAIVGALPHLLNAGYLVLHQTGPKLYGETLDMLEALPSADLSPRMSSTAGDALESSPVLESVTLKDHPAYRCQPYINNMAPVLAASTLTLCRSGSLSLSEMLVAGIPMVLVPYPYAAADHQTRNAEALVKAGAADMLTDAECSPDAAFNLLNTLLTQPDRLSRMRQACAQLAKPYATREIVGLLTEEA